MTRFESPIALLLLLAIPVCWWAWRRRERAAVVMLPSMDLVRGVGRSWRTRAASLLIPMRALALAAMIVALARPQAGVGKTSVVTEGVAIMMVVDRSGSMGEEMAFGGEVMTRLDVVKRVFREFVVGTKKLEAQDGVTIDRSGDALEGRPNDLIGIVSFARYAETVCPLVRDPQAVSALVETLDLPLVRSEDGTAIGDGVALAAARLRDAEEDLKRRAIAEASGRDVETTDERVAVEPGFTIKSKAIVLLTDGEMNAGEVGPLEAANLSREWGIRVYTIAVGGGERVVQTPLGAMRVPSRGVDETVLRRMAEMTDGRHFSASDAEGLRGVYAAINALEKSRVESREYTEYTEWFWPLAAAGAALLALETLASATFLRRAP
ncbi:MAG: vWA domain-containing protein [Phycisphaerales bacterium]